MLIPILVLLASFIPSLGMFFFLRKNRDDKEYHKACGRLLLKGVLCAVGITLVDLVLKTFWGIIGIGDKNWLIDELFHNFIVYAGAEEAVKFYFAKKSIKKDLTEVSRLDIISFMALTAMGFGLFEAVIYAVQTNIPQIIVRGILMGHVGYGLLMGLAYSKGVAQNKNVYKVLALLLPIFVHGLYDFSLNDKLPELFMYLAVLNAIATTVFIIVMISFIRKKRKDPSYTSNIYSERTSESEEAGSD